MGFVAATYNVLATAYVRPQYFPRTPPELLDPVRRREALAHHLARLEADFICMQEVETETFAAMERALAPLGRAGTFALKGGGKPDGCAIFWRTDMFECVRDERVEYDDGSAELAPSGHIAQFVVLRNGDRLLGVANTHLKWHPPDTAPERHYGLRQIRQLLEARTRVAHGCQGWIACGDFNVTREDAVVRELERRGFQCSHRALPAATCNPGGRAKMIDYLFHDAGLVATPLPVTHVEDDTPLPGTNEPSDHVAVCARMEWA